MAQIAVRLRDRVRLIERGKRIPAAVLSRGDVGQPDQVRGHTRQGTDLPAQPRRLLQALARLVKSPGPVCRDAEMPQGLRLRLLVADGRREVAGPLQIRNCGGVVAPNDLPNAADPEQRLGLATHIAQRLIQLSRVLEQRQLGWVLDRQGPNAGPLVEEPRMQDPAAGERRIGLHRVQVPFGTRQRSDVAGEHGLLVEHPGPFDPLVAAHLITLTAQTITAAQEHGKGPGQRRHRRRARGPNCFVPPAGLPKDGTWFDQRIPSGSLVVEASFKL